jgi:hypothetical protein
MAWRPRLAGSGWSYVFFGDRFAAGDIKAEPTPTSVDSGPGYAEIEQIAKAASIRIIGSK